MNLLKTIKALTYKVSAFLLLVILAGNASAQIINTVASNVPADDICADKSGNIYWVYAATNSVYKLSAAGQITIVAGNGTGGFSGDGGLAINAELYNPRGIGIDAAGNIYIADTQNFRIRKVGTNGYISTVAGNGVQSDGPDGGAATATALYSPSDVAFDQAGNMFVATALEVRKINSSGVITTVAGNETQLGYSGDGGLATSAGINGSDNKIYIDASNNLYITQSYYNVVRKVNTSGIISTFAGNGNSSGSSGDGGQAKSATCGLPNGIVGDASGNIYISSPTAYAVRKINSSGIITTYAGTYGSVGYSGEGGPATAAKLIYPGALCFDSTGSLIFGDSNYFRRVCNPLSAPASITGNSSVLSPSTQTYSIAPVTGATSYTWTLPTGWAGSSTTNSITATLQAGAVTGTVSVAANNFCGAGTAQTLAVTVTYAAPTITSFTPTKGFDGTTITITGANFTSATAVLIGGKNASSFTIVSDTQITAAVSSLGSSGSVTVTTPYGSASLAGFTYLPPAITSFSPTSAGATGTVVITGSNFTGASLVSFGGTAARSYTVDSPTQITAVVGAGTSGAVSVKTAGGTATLAGFIFIPQPIITSFIPTSGKFLDTVTITGNNFTNATGVSFGGTPAGSFTVNSPTSITAIVNVGSSGSVSVTTNGTPGTLSGFTYNLTPQTIVFTAIPTQPYGGADLPAYVYGTNNNWGYQLYASTYLGPTFISNPVTLSSSNTAVATINSTGIHIVGVGKTTITASRAGQGVFASATPVSQVLTVSKAPQTITFNPIPTKYAGNANFSPFATSSAGLAIAYTSSNTSVATIVNGNIQILAAGTTVITASQAGNAYYLAASPVTQTLVITAAPASPGVTYATPQTYVVGKTITPLSPASSGPAVNPGEYGEATVINSFGTGGALLNYTTYQMPYTTAVDASGNMYVADGANFIIKKISPAGALSTFAGSGAVGFTDGTGAAASFAAIAGITIDGLGNIYVADAGNQAIRKITSAGVVTTLTWSGITNLSTILGSLTGIAADKSSNNIYVVSAGTIYQIGLSSQIINTVASSPGNYVTGIAVDSFENLYAGTLTSILKYSVSSGGFSQATLAGGANPGSADGTGTAASFNNITGVAVDVSGNVYVADNGNNVIRMVSPAGVVTTIAGTGALGSANGSGASATFSHPYGIATDAAGNLYAGDSGTNQVRKVVLNGYFINSTLSPGLSFNGATGMISGTPLRPAPATVYKITANNTAGGSNTASLTITVSALAAPKLSYSGPNSYPTGTPISALTPAFSGGAIPVPVYGQSNNFGGYGSLNMPNNAAMDAAGNIYVMDGLLSGVPEIKKITPSGTTTIFASNNLLGSASYQGSLAADSAGNVYVVFGNYPYGVKKITAAGVTSVLTNSITNFQNNQTFAADYKGNIYIASGTEIYKLTQAGALSILAGNDVYNSVDGTGTAASFSNITALAVDKSGNVYVTEDTGDHTAVRMITPAGVVTTIAGGNASYPVIDGVGKAATFDYPYLITADAAGNLYVVDGSALRKIAPGGVVSTMVADYAPNSGDYGAIMADGFGNVFGLFNLSTINETSLPGFTINPSLPAGLSFDSTTGIISGTPTQANRATSYTVTAYNTCGAGTAKVNITITSTVKPPNISYTGSSSFTTNVAITPLVPVNTGGAVQSAGYSISPALPAGLSFDVNTGIISGTPAVQSIPTAYSITATNSGGGSTFQQIISIINPIPAISYPATLSYPVGNAINPVIPVNTGGAFMPSVYGQNTVFAGSGAAEYADGRGVAASFNGPNGLATDAAGNVYVADLVNLRVRKVTPAAVVSTLAGNNFRGTADGTGAAASFSFALNSTNTSSISSDASGNVYVENIDASYNNEMRKITPAGVVTTYLDGIYMKAFVSDGAGNIFFTDGYTVKEAMLSGSIITIAGSDTNIYQQTDGAGTNASFTDITAITIDHAGNLYVADETLDNIAINMREVTQQGLVTTLQASFPDYDGVNGSAIAIDNSGNFYLSDQTHIGKASPGGAATVIYYSLQFTPIAIDPSGNYLYTINGSNQISSIALSNNTVSFTIDPALPQGLAFDAATGTISGTPTLVTAAANYNYTAYCNGGRSGGTINLSVYLPLPDISYTTPQNYTVGNLISPLVPGNSGGPVSFDNLVSTYAGSLTAGYTDGPAASAQFNGPSWVVVDKQGNIYVSDSQNNVIREISITGTVSTFAGSGTFGFTNGAGTAASFSSPGGLAIDANGNIFVADQANSAIRKITPAGVVTTYAGSGVPGLTNGAAATAKFSFPTGLVFDKTGNLYVGDERNNVIRKISAAGVVSTFAGALTSGSADGTGTAARFSNPEGLAMDAGGNIYVADEGNRLIRKITPTGVVTTIAGNSVVYGAVGAVNFSNPIGLTFDIYGNLYISDYNVIRKIASNGAVSIAAGNISYFGFQNGRSAILNFTEGMTADTSGNIYVADYGNSMIREIGPSGYNIKGPLPAGLSFDSTTGMISGTPTAAVPAKNYQVAAYNDAGVDTTGINISTLSNQTLTFPPLNAVTYGVADFAPGATSTDNTIPIAYTSSNTGVATIVSGKIHVVGAGTTNITASQGADSLYTAASSISQTLLVNAQNQTITFSALPAKTYGAIDFVPVAKSTNATIPIVYSSSNITVATIVNGSIHITGGGTTTITASQSAGPNYLAATNVSQTLTVNPAAQAITFAALTAKTYGAADYAIVASTGSKLPLTYSSSNTAVATIINGNLHIVGVGTSVITASQAGNADYQAAAPVNQTLTVNKTVLNIKANSQAIAYGAALPVLTITYTGFVNNETNAVLTTQPGITTTATATSPAGSYPITASGAAAANYSITYSGGTLTINKAAQTVAFAALPAGMYGGAAIIPTATASSGLAVTYTSSDTTIIKVGGAGLQIKGVGTATITANQAGNANYLPAPPVSQPLTVGQGNQTITFAALAAKTYGAADFSLTATASSKLAVTYTSSDPTVAQITGTTVHIVSGGTVTITATQAGSAQYLPAVAVSRQLVVNPAAQAITFAALAAKTYGAADFAIVASTGSKLPLSYSSSNPSVATIANGNIHIVGAGTSVITASQAGNADYNAATAVSETLTVNNAVLNIKANSQSITYGAALPALGVTYTGFVNGETNTVLTTQPAVATTATASSPAGSYPVTASGAAAANYTITYTGGTLTIGKAAQTISFSTLPAASYGGTPIKPSATASSGQVVTFASSDTTVIKVSGTNLLIIGVGTATITASQAGNANYLPATPVGQGLTVGKGSQTITFGALTAKTYGAVDFTLAATATSKLGVSFTSSDATVVQITGTSAHIVAAGTATITANQAGNVDYLAAAPVTQTFTVNQASQTITFAALATKTYGAADAALTATASSKLAVTYTSSNTTVATIVNGAIHIVSAGTSVITASQAGNGDYAAATAVTQTLTVNKAALTVKANSQTISYGAALPVLTVSYTGFVNGETSTVLTVQPAVSTTATATSPASSYPVTASGAAAANYTITYTAGTLTIGRASQTITFATLPPASYKGAPIKPSAAASSGLAVTFASSDTTIIKVSGANLTIQGVGTATITANQAGNVDYLAAPPVSQLLTVGKSSQTITFAATVTKTYGAANYATATASSGLAINYTSSNTAVATIVNGAVHIAGAGTSVITASQGGNVDYSAATAVTQTLTVNKAALNIKANNQSITAGSAIPVLTVTYTGLVNGDANTNLATQPTVSTTATASSPAGTYPITATGALSGNYSITYTAGALTITASGLAKAGDAFTSISVNDDHTPLSMAAEPVVKQAVSPNGDGVNDVLLIDNIGNFPDNKLVIMSRDGARVFEAARYDNVNHAFDGHSSITGRQQLPGTYFYLLEYRVKGEWKRKTGFFILKY